MSIHIAVTGCSAEALSGDIHIDADDTRRHDVFVKRLLQVQHDAFQACLQSAIAEINKRVDHFIRETTTSLTELPSQFPIFTDATRRTCCETLTPSPKSNALRLSGKRVTTVQSAFRRHSGRRKRNLGADGKNVRREMTTSLELSEPQVRAMTIERAHRTGRTGSKARTIVIKFVQYKDRELVLAEQRFTNHGIVLYCIVFTFMYCIIFP